MLRKVFITLFLALPVVVAADTRIDLDRHTDFSRYKTFTLEVEPSIRADGLVEEHNTIAENRLRQAVTREFQARGLEAIDVGADLTVHVSSREIEQSVPSFGWDAYPYPWGWRGRWGYWGYARGWGYPGYWGQWGPYTGDVWAHRYLEGTVTIDVIEGATGGLVYRAEVTDAIKDNRDKQVIEMVRKAFKKFPVKEMSGK